MPRYQAALAKIDWGSITGVIGAGGFSHTEKYHQSSGKPEGCIQKRASPFISIHGT
jgi:hypothetical protein